MTSLSRPRVEFISTILQTVLNLGLLSLGLIIAGLLSSNTAFVVQGGLVVGILAVLIHHGFQALERRAGLRTGRD